ncbi:MAG TPA: histone deacetylase [Gemmatimonadales bacterium]|jgi:acetoin utilization deacetylase AcuC-like enzyme|nr:histone deacetylase [Gemmatimonadales bacterium]
MPVPVFTHPDCLRHDPGPGHPETPERLVAILERVRGDARFLVSEATPAHWEALLPVHPREYLQWLEETSHQGGGVVFVDTVMNDASWDAVLGATGAVLAAVAWALPGRHAFAAIRPPGHHALAQRAMGFCLVNNVVVGARAAQRQGRRRVLIVDWDVHHGNGTQALVQHDETIRFVSLHQHPWYPGTGMAEERGVGNIFNVPRPAGAPPELYVEDLWAAIAAATTRWEPEMVFISAGFDSMRGDPLGGFTLEPDHYATLTYRLREELDDAPIVGLLEGGYAPPRIAEGVAAHVGALG